MVLWWMVPLWCFMVPATGLMSIEKDSTELGGGGLFQGIFRFLKRNSRKNSFTQQKVNHELDSTLYDLKRKRRSNLASGTENQKA